MDQNVVLDFFALARENWLLAVGTMLAALSATYLFTFVKALADEHGKTAPKRFKNASQRANKFLSGHKSVLILLVAAGSITAFWTLTKNDPCLKPSELKTIGEKILCDIAQ